MATGAQEVAVEAQHLALAGPRGEVFSGVSFAAQPGELTAIAGPGGSGRTCLLLTLAGRMRPTGGVARVGDHVLPAEAGAVRRLVTVARAGGAVEIEGRWRAREAVALRGVLRGRPVAAREAADALAAVGIDPGGDAFVDEIGPQRRTLLAVALARLEAPPAVVVDDVDDGVDVPAERAIWRTLRALADAGVTVLATTTGREAPAGVADRVIDLGPER